MFAPRRTYIVLVIGLLAVSQSGNIIRLGDAPAVTIAAWRLALAIGLGLVGVAVTGAGDFVLGLDHLWGDVLALVCSALFTVYFLLGKRLRRELPSTVYITGVYGVAAITGFVVMLTLDIPLTGYSDRTWLCFGLMALLPTILGHGALNHAVHYIDAGRISAATLVEPILAGLVAWIAWDEIMTSWTVTGYVIICVSVLVLASDMRRQSATSGTRE